MFLAPERVGVSLVPPVLLLLFGPQPAPLLGHLPGRRRSRLLPMYLLL